MKCNHCGAEIANDSVFCEHCGKKLSEKPTDDVGNKTSEGKNTRKNKRKKIILYVAGGVAAIAIMFVVFVARKNGQNDFIRTSELYYQNQPIIKSDYDKGGYGGALNRDYWGEGQYFLHYNEQFNGPAIVKMNSSMSNSHDELMIFGKDDQIIFDRVEYSAPFTFAYIQNGSEDVHLSMVTEDNIVTDLGYCDINHLWGLDGQGRIPSRYNETQENCHYYDSTIFACGLQPVKKNGKWGYIDTNGNEAIQCIYEDAYPFEYGMAVVAINDNTGVNPAWWLIDHNGNKLFFICYTSSVEYIKGFNLDGVKQFFSNGLMPVYSVKGRDGTGGYIDRKGSWVISGQYYNVIPFNYGLAAVKELLPGRDSYDWIFIDDNNRTVIPEVVPAIRECSNFTNENGTVQATVWDFFGNVYKIDRKTLQWSRINTAKK